MHKGLDDVEVEQVLSDLRNAPKWLRKTVILQFSFALNEICKKNSNTFKLINPTINKYKL